MLLQLSILKVERDLLERGANIYQGLSMWGHAVTFCAVWRNFKYIYETDRPASSLEI